VNKISIRGPALERLHISPDQLIHDFGRMFDEHGSRSGIITYKPRLAFPQGPPVSVVGERTKAGNLTFYAQEDPR